jgi:hypothetical protein
MPEEETEPPPLPSRLERYLLGRVTLGDPRFTSKRLADQAHAARLLAELRRARTVV